MSVRITSSMLLRTSLADVMNQRARLARIQEQASSGLRINRPSDDPGGARAAMLLRSELTEIGQFERNQDRADERLRGTEVALDQGQDILQRARELAVQGSNGTLDATSRQALAAEIEQLHTQMLSLSNTRSSGAHLFAGFANDSAAFNVAGPFTSGSPAPVVSFVGDASEIEAEVDQGVRLSTTLNGERVFLGDSDGDGNPDAGKEDVFGVLGQLWEALDTNDATATANTLDALDRAHTQLTLERTRLGGIGARIEAARMSVGERRTSVTELLSAIEDADTVAVFSDLVNQETALRASLEAASRLIQPSLADFLA